MTTACPSSICRPTSAAASGKAAVARETAAACEEIGFLVIEGHGIAPQLVAELFAVGRACSTCRSTKEPAAPAAGVSPRGYHALGTKYLARTLGEDTPPDLREQFYIGPLTPDLGPIRHIPGVAKFYEPNIWPETPAAFRDTRRATTSKWSGWRAI